MGVLSDGSHKGRVGRGRSRERKERFESLRRELPKRITIFSLLATYKEESQNRKEEAGLPSIVGEVGVSPLRIAPQLWAQGHVEARRQMVLPIRGHTAKDRLAVRRDAAARRHWLAVVGAGAAKVLDFLWRRKATETDVSRLRAFHGERRLATSPVPETDPW